MNRSLAYPLLLLLLLLLLNISTTFLSQSEAGVTYSPRLPSSPPPATLNCFVVTILHYSSEIL